MAADKSLVVGDIDSTAVVSVSLLDEQPAESQRWRAHDPLVFVRSSHTEEVEYNIEDASYVEAWNGIDAAASDECNRNR